MQRHRCLLPWSQAGAGLSLARSFRRRRARMLIRHTPSLSPSLVLPGNPFRPARAEGRNASVRGPRERRRDGPPEASACLFLARLAVAALTVPPQTLPPVAPFSAMAGPM